MVWQRLAPLGACVAALSSSGIHALCEELIDGRQTSDLELKLVQVVFRWAWVCTLKSKFRFQKMFLAAKLEPWCACQRLYMRRQSPRSMLTRDTNVFYYISFFIVLCFFIILEAQICYASGMVLEAHSPRSTGKERSGRQVIFIGDMLLIIEDVWQMIIHESFRR